MPIEIKCNSIVIFSGQHIFFVYGILMVDILVCLRTWNKGNILLHVTLTMWF